MKTNKPHFLTVYLQIIIFYLFFIGSNPVFSQTAILNGICDLNRFIPDIACIEVPIIVNNAPGITLGQDVFLKEVRLTIRHPWRNDLQVKLYSPDKSIVVQLIDERGGSSDHFGDPTIENCAKPLILTDSPCAVNTIKNVASTTEAIGLFTPEEDLSKFYGLTPFNPNATWTLEVCDDKSGDIGVLEYVELVFEPSGCIAPTNVVVTDINPEMVDLSWESTNTCQNNTIIEYGLMGFTPGNGMMAGSVNSQVQVLSCTNSTELIGLTELTIYDVYVRELCAAGNYAYNACKTSFKTDCNLPVTTLFENFDTQRNCGANGTCIDCPTVSGVWTNDAINDEIDWIVNSGQTVTSRTGPNSDISGNEQYIYVESSGTCRPGKEAILNSSCIEIKAGEGICHLSFYYHMYGVNVNALHLEISTDNGLSWINLWEETGNQGDEWKLQYINLSEYNGQLAQLRFRAISAAVNFRGDIALDNISFYGSTTIENQKLYADKDDDGYGDISDFIFTCSAELDGYVLNSKDCDDTNSTIFPVESDELAIICEGETFDFNGEMLMEAGIYFDTLKTEHDCDSLITLILWLLETESAEAGLDQLLCADTTVLEANLTDEAIGSWSIISGDGLHTFVESESPNTIFKGTLGQNYLLEWLVFDKTCFSINRDTVWIQFLDSDNDGVTDCEDLCPNGDDTINTDNLGMPDACDCDPNDASDEFIVENGDEAKDNKINLGDYQASFSLTSKGIIAKDSIITFRAGAEISLLPGFVVEAGGQFYATIETCTSSQFTEGVLAATRIREMPIIEIAQRSPLIEDFTIVPNPFHHSTTIKYELSKNTAISLQIFSMNGELVKELIPQQNQNKGYYEYLFEPNTNSGNVYFAILITEEEVVSKKMIFIK